MKGQPHSSFKRNNINFTTFTELLKGKTNKASKYYKIGSKNHRVTKFLQRKRNLVSAFDDKRWLYSCKIHSLPYGSCHAKKENSRKCPFCLVKAKKWTLKENINVVFAWSEKMCNLPKKFENKYIYLKNLISEVSHLIIIEWTRCGTEVDLYTFFKISRVLWVSLFLPTNSFALAN